MMPKPSSLLLLRLREPPPYQSARPPILEMSVTALAKATAIVEIRIS